MVLDSAKARERIESIEDLPTLPSVATQIIALANSPRTNAADVGKMIEQDQSLTAKVLKLVNSAFYGFPGQIKSISHAVVIIGFNKVKNVVMTASVFDLSKGRPAHRLDVPRFWQHSLGTAIGAKVIAPTLGGGLQPDDAFVAGLIHSLGILILDQYLSDDFEKVLQFVEASDAPLRDAEKDVLGFNHNQVGTWIVEKWKLPRPLRNAIRFYSTPQQAREDREMVAAVHLGDIFSRALLMGDPCDAKIPPIHEGIWQQYNLTSAFLDETMTSMLEELRKAKDFLDLIDEGS